MRNLNILLENALDAVVGADRHEKIIYWNSQAEKTFGWLKAEALQKNMADLIIPERFRSAHRRGMAHYLKTGVGPILNQRIEVPALRKDSSEFPCELTVSVIEQDGEVSFFSFMRDVTSEKEVEAERTRLLDEAKRAVKARDEFISICSHELKTPMTSVLLQLQYAARQIRSGDTSVLAFDPSLQRTEASISQLKRITRLIDDMLDTSRIETGKLYINPSSFNLFELVSELAVRFELQAATAPITLVCPSPEKTTVYADRDRVEQVFINLMTNATKYGEGKEIRLEFKEETSGVKVSVIDQGKGIENESLVRIFEKFERGKHSQEISGMGIGLYICRSIVESHGGKIEVKSERGKGSSFTVSLPYTLAPAVEPI